MYGTKTYVLKLKYVLESTYSRTVPTGRSRVLQLTVLQRHAGPYLGSLVHSLPAPWSHADGSLHGVRLRLTVLVTLHCVALSRHCRPVRIQATERRSPDLSAPSEFEQQQMGDRRG
jgi:hypothetical protein